MKSNFTFAEGTTYVDMSDAYCETTSDVVEDTYVDMSDAYCETTSDVVEDTYVDMSKGYRRCAFTLAEILITLGIIGVVAALTIPGVINNINDKIKNTRITTINSKLKQGTDKLMLMEHINGYESTEDFVKKLSGHMKISSWCSADKIDECFPYKQINVDGADEPVEVSDLNTPQAFGLDENDYANPVSFITGDGTPYIILYNKNCKIDDGDARSNSTGCISGIYDWNGARVPNKFTTTTNAKTGFAETDIQFLGGVNKLAKYIVADGSFNNVTAGGYKYYKILDEYKYTYDYANKTCKSLGMSLPSVEDMVTVFCEYHGPAATVYDNNTSYSFPGACSNYTQNSTLRTKLTNPKYIFLTSSSNDGIYFLLQGNYNHGGGPVSYDSIGNMNRTVICLGK